MGAGLLSTGSDYFALAVLQAWLAKYYLWSPTNLTTIIYTVVFILTCSETGMIDSSDNRKLDLASTMSASIFTVDVKIF